jgi:NADH-quinone oxidoreductase subunit M
MSAYAGSLVPVTTPYVSLDRIPLVLLLGALVVAFSRGRLEPRQRHSISLVSIGMALGLLAVHVVHLVMLEPARRALRDVTTNLVRIGSFDASFGFFLDPAAAFLLFLPLVGSAFFLAQTKFVKADPSGASRFQASVLLLCAGVSTSLLADGFIGLVVGLSLAIVAMYLLCVHDKLLHLPVVVSGRLFLLQSAGIACVLSGFVLLFWSLGGTWRHDGYLANYRARFVAVHAHDRLSGPEDVVVPDESRRGERDAALVARRAKERGSLTFTSHPGARVFIDAGDKDLARMEPFATSPFVRKDLSVGPHDVVIVPDGAAIVTGDGHEVAWIERLVIATGENVSLVAVGQTTTFSEIEDQLELVDEEGKHFLRNALFNNAIDGSFSVTSIFAFLLGFGALLLAAPVLIIPWLARTSSPSTWNVLRFSAVVLALYPLLRLRSIVEFHFGILAILFAAAAVLVAVVRMRKPSLLLGTAALVAASLFFVPNTAHAFKDREERLTMRPERGDIVELDYAPDGETMVGAFVIRNISPKPVTLTGAGFIQNVPPFVTIEIEGAKGKPVVVESGKERRALIRWKYGAARAREFYGLAYAEPSDTRAERPVPVHAARSRDLGAWGDRALSIVLGFPLLASLLAIVLRLLRRDTPRVLAASSTFIFAVQLAFVAAISWRFDKSFGRADGNDGYQFIERFVLAPSHDIEYFLGLDGIALTLVITVSIAALLASLASMSLRDRAVWFHMVAPVFVSSVIGVFISLDLFLFCAFWFVGAFAATLLVAFRGTEAARRAAWQLGAVSFAGMLFLGGAAYWLFRHSDTTYLVDGRFVLSTLAIPDLARLNWANVGATLFDTRGIVVVWIALFVTFVLRLVTLGNVFAESNTPTNILVPAALIGTGIHGLLRLELGVMPQGTKWAAATVIALGLIMMIAFTLFTRFQTNRKDRVAHGATAYAGFVLVGLGSCTPQGIAAMVYVAVSLALAIALFAMLEQALDSRAITVENQRFGGLSQDMPLFAALFLVATFVLMGLPGLAGFWGPLLAVVGVFPRQPLLAIVVIAGIVFFGAVHMFFAGRILFGAAHEKRVDPLTDLRRDEVWVIVPLVVFVVGLGLAPRTVFSLLDAVILDLHRLVDAAGALQVG